MHSSTYKTKTISSPHPSRRSDGTIKVQYGQSHPPPRKRQPSHLSCIQNRKNVRYSENLKYTPSETKMKLYAIVKKPDVKQSRMCSNRNECLGKLLTDRDLLDPPLSPAQPCSVGVHGSGNVQWCQRSPSSADHRQTMPVWPNVTSEVTGLPQSFMNLSTIPISSSHLTLDSMVFGLLPLTSGTPFSLLHSEITSLAFKASHSSTLSKKPSLRVSATDEMEDFNTSSV